MGLVVMGMGIYLLFVIFLCVYFILYVLINSRKVGFLKTVKSKTAIVTIILIFLCGGIFIGSFIPRSGNQLFKDFVLKPMPKSVKVLDSYDGITKFGASICLHFKISPADFQLILASKKWETVSESPIGGLQCELGKKAWDFSFPPPSLGSNVITYTFIPRERVVEIIFTNAQMNDVYYFSHNGNVP